MDPGRYDHHPPAALATLLGALACLTVLQARGALAGQWVAHNNGLKNLTVVGIGIAPSQPSTIYLQVRSLGVYKSTNGGQSWAKTTTFNSDQGPGLDHLLHQGPVVHPTNPNLVWVASSGQVYKTTSGGSAWSLSSTGTTVNGCNGVQGLTLDPNNSDHLFAGTIISGCDGGVFESTDGGTNWTNIAGSAKPASTLGNDAFPIALEASDTSKLYCGSPHESVSRSTDGGHTWTNSPPVPGDASTYEVVINPQLPNEIWCAENGGTWTSSNYGASWIRRTDLFGNQAISVLRFAPSNAQVAYALVGSTVWRSDDQAAAWSAQAAVPGGPRCLEIDPTKPEVVYVGTWGMGMYKSTDGARSFTEINTGLPLTQLIHGQQAFAVGDYLYCVLAGNVMYRSPRDNLQWEYHSAAPANYILVDRFHPNRWFCAAGALWRSVDAGSTWTAAYSQGAATDIYGFWLDPRTCDRILIGDRNGNKVLLSQDGGDTWTVKGTIPLTPAGFNVLSDLSGDPFDPNVVVAAAYPTYTSNRQCGYLWRTADGGQTWSSIRDRMFYGDWRIGDGEWSILGYVMRQRIKPYCNYRVVLDHHVFGDGSYECMMRIVGSNNNDPSNWAGFMVRLASPDANYTTSGWLVYMRRSGVVTLYNPIDGNVINVDQTPIVPDPSVFTTVRLQTTGNRFELFVNGTSIGTYTDPNHRWDGTGYFGLVTCQTEAEFDDVSIQTEQSYADHFNVYQAYGASYSRWLTADAHNPGVFTLSSQGGGVWRSTDHGLTWRRVTDDNGEGLVNYRPITSALLNGNVFVCRGAGYSWRIDNLYNQGSASQQLGQGLAYSSLVVTQDPRDLNRLYAAVYSQGVLVYEGTDMQGELAPPFPTRGDFDGDGDVDQDDFGHFQRCYTGAGVYQTDPDCRDTLLDGDNDTDSLDFSAFAACMSGANIPADPACNCPTR